jgi:uncharacterized protein (TIGR03435 family)
MYWRLSLICTLIAACSAQTPKARFEVASVKPSAEFPSPNAAHGAQTSDPTRFFRDRATLANLILEAFHISKYQLVAPAWLETARFDIQAIVPKGSTMEERRSMLQTLLAERFHLRFHRETREVSGYRLTVAKGGLKLRELPPGALPPSADAPPHAGPVPVALDSRGMPVLPPGINMLTTSVNGRMITTITGSESMSVLAGRLAASLHQPVIDWTALSGAYRYSLSWATNSLLATPSDPSGDTSDPAGGPTIFQALESQLGLKLVKASVRVEMLLIDRVDRFPTQN